MGLSDKKINIDFDKIPKYFKGLGRDMQLAWGVVALGIILIIVGLML